ncbi:hypothetical protein PICSAR65_03055 [Mycobacterium avium subsp. paratuberculosis]|nr:hypothetical protein PICSAR65_03055 [Mycobacterium avium subsp. paratuberculosis]
MSSRRSFNSAVTASSTGSPERIVTISRALRQAASWLTKVADNGSSSCASSTTTTKFLSWLKVLCAAASMTAGSFTAVRLTACENAPRGTAEPVWVPSAYRTVRPADSTVLASMRASVDLPTPASPTNATPWNSALLSAASDRRSSASRPTMGHDPTSPGIGNP